MKGKWKYLLGAFLLASGLLAGCVKESGQPPQGVQEIESQEQAAQDPAQEAMQGAGPENMAQEAMQGAGPENMAQEAMQGAEPENPAQEAMQGAEPEDPAQEALQERDQEKSEPDMLRETGAGTLTAEAPPDEQLPEEGAYTSKEEVAEYIYLYGHLPDNFITKKEAKALGWVSSEGNLGEVAPGKSIGGDYFGNFEGNLPEKDGRDYHECDIDSTGGYRGAKRIVYSNDGLIYYTEDHYETFELLYGEE